LDNRHGATAPKIDETARGADRLRLLAPLSAQVRRHISPASKLQEPRKATLRAAIDKERLVSRLSIVIPCRGGAAEFDGTLVSVLQNRPTDSEVLVVHSKPYDDPYALRGEVNFIEVENDSLVEMLNAALDHASGEVLHIVGCGLETTESWIAPALAHFDDPDVAAVAPVVLTPDRRQILSAGVRWSLGGARCVVNDQRIISPGSGRLRAKIQGPALIAAFYRREVLEALDGFDTTVGDDLADVAMALAIHSLGWLTVCEPASQLVRDGDVPAAARGSFARSQAAERLFCRYAHERGVIASLMLHPGTIAADVVSHLLSPMLLTSLLGRAAAWLEFGAAQSHAQHLGGAAQRLKDLADRRATSRKTTSLSQAIADDLAAPRRRAA
jgi:hypothetical protein